MDYNQVNQFFATLEECGQIAASARGAGVTLLEVHGLLGTDPTFERRYQAAMHVFSEKVSKEAMRRGVEGWLEPVFWQGQIVGEVRKFSDRLLELVLKRYDAAYRERMTVDQHVSGGVMVVGEPAASTQEWVERHRDAAAERELDKPSK